MAALENLQWAEPRVADYVVSKTGCWVWVGYTTGRGYAAVRTGNTSRVVHRILYERDKGPIPDGMVLDHLCRNIRCVNPDHLEAVTVAENTRRGIGPSAINAMKTHCPKGHPYTDDNVSVRRNRRYCRACDAKHKIAHRLRKTAALAKEGGQ